MNWPLAHIWYFNSVCDCTNKFKYLNNWPSIKMHYGICAKWFIMSHNKVKMQYVHCRIIATYFLFLGKILQKWADGKFPFITEAVYTIPNIRKYNFLAWEWIKVKLYVEWRYLPCFLNAHTVFLLCSAVLCPRLLFHRYLAIKLPTKLSH